MRTLSRVAIKVMRLDRARLLVAVLALAGTGTTGAAVSIKTVVNSDHAACSSLLAMVKAAGVLNMSDEQLCDFRFARLPPSQTKGFAFPTWTVMPVAAPSAMYFKLLNVNLAPDKVSTYGYPWTDLIDAAKQATADHNLIFYKTELPLEGKGALLTFVQMDVKQCSTLAYMRHITVPYYAVFDQPDLQRPDPVKMSASNANQIALWKGHIPVEITIDNHWEWLRFVPEPPSIVVTLQGLARSSVDGPFEGAIHSYPVCQFNILNTAKPHKEPKP